MLEEGGGAWEDGVLALPGDEGLDWAAECGAEAEEASAEESSDQSGEDSADEDGVVGETGGVACGPRDSAEGVEVNGHGGACADAPLLPSADPPAVRARSAIPRLPRVPPASAEEGRAGALGGLPALAPPAMSVGVGPGLAPAPLPPHRERPAPRPRAKAASEITREDLATCFHLPSELACRALGIGLTVLKRQCRKFGIKRWPFRKMKSLDRLITNVQAGITPSANGAITLKSVEELEAQKRQMEVCDIYDLDEETKRLQQAFSKANHKLRRQAGSVAPRPKRRARSPGFRTGAAARGASQAGPPAPDEEDEEEEEEEEGDPNKRRRRPNPRYLEVEAPQRRASGADVRRSAAGGDDADLLASLADALADLTERRTTGGAPGEPSAAAAAAAGAAADAPPASDDQADAEPAPQVRALQQPDGAARQLTPVPSLADARARGVSAALRRHAEEVQEAVTATLGMGAYHTLQPHLEDGYARLRASLDTAML